MVHAHPLLYQSATDKPRRMQSCIERLLCDLLYERCCRITEAKCPEQRRKIRAEMDRLKSITSARELIAFAERHEEVTR